MFLGAHSNISQADWFWENGTMINDTNFPTSDPSLCQQMLLPSTYDDGINLLPKRCDYESYFACEIPRKVFLSKSSLFFVNENLPSIQV